MKLCQFSKDPFYFWQISTAAILHAYIGHHQLHFTGLGSVCTCIVTGVARNFDWRGSKMKKDCDKKNQLR